MLVAHKKYFKITATVAALFDSNGNRKEPNKRNYKQKIYNIVAESSSDALTKCGRRITAEELTVQQFNFI